MGGSGGDYRDDVNFVRQASSTSDFSDVSRDDIIKKHEPDKSVLPVNFKGIEIYKGQDIVIVLIDGTGSMGTDTFIIRDKIVMLEGQLRTQGYLKNPLIMIGIIGDAYSDRYPIQITKPERGDPLIVEIERTYPESGGGGTGMESYELMAYYLVHHMKLDDTMNKPFVFFLGDEAMYPEVDPSCVKKHIGDNISLIDSGDIFKQLCKKFNVFRLHRYAKDYPTIDEKIFGTWQKMIGAERVQRLTESKAVVDDILGIIAVGTKSRTIDSYANDMRKRGQTDTRIENVRKVLLGVEKAIVPIKDVPKLPGVSDTTKKRVSGSVRLN